MFRVQVVILHYQQLAMGVVWMGHGGVGGCWVESVVACMKSGVVVGATGGGGAQDGCWGGVCGVAGVCWVVWFPWLGWMVGLV